MSSTVDRVESGDHRAPKLPVEGNGEMGVKIPAGNRETGDAHTLKEPDRKKEKRGRKKDKEKKKKKERETGGWCAKLMSCFVCGGASQDEWERLEEEEEERLRIQERVKKAREADLQRFLKMREVNLMRKEAFKRMQRRREMVEANKEWSALPLKSEETGRKVTFREVDACDVWFYQEEANPRQGEVWKRVLKEIRDNEMARALQEKWIEKEEQLIKTEEKHIAPQRQENHIAPQRQEAARSQSSFSKLVVISLLCLGFGVLLWFLPQCNQQLQ